MVIVRGEECQDCPGLDLQVHHQPRGNQPRDNPGIPGEEPEWEGADFVSWKRCGPIGAIWEATDFHQGRLVLGAVPADKPCFVLVTKAQKNTFAFHPTINALNDTAHEGANLIPSYETVIPRDRTLMEGKAIA